MTHLYLLNNENSQRPNWTERKIKTLHLKMQKWILLMFSCKLVNSHHTAVFRDAQTVGVSAACNYPTVYGLWSQILDWLQSDTMNRPEPEPVITNTEAPAFTRGVHRTCLRTHSTDVHVCWDECCSWKFFSVSFWVSVPLKAASLCQTVV